LGENPEKEEVTYDLRQQGLTNDGSEPLWAHLTHVQAEAVVTGEEERIRNEGIRDPRLGASKYIGAMKHSNNTGELTAMYRALQRALARDGADESEDIWTDSLYARNMTLGIWKPRRHHSSRHMIENLRRMWWQIQRRRGIGTVRINHVRSHTEVPGNELADALAELGKMDEQPTLEWAHTRMRAITRQRASAPPHGTQGRTPPHHHHPHTPVLSTPPQPEAVAHTPPPPGDPG
jgi:ribonuclease HI